MYGRDVTASAEVTRAYREAFPSSPTLDQVVRNLQLTPFEREVLLLAIAPEIDPAFGARPTVASALEVVAAACGVTREAALASLLPEAHLTRCGLIELVGDVPFLARELRVPATVWPRLAGLANTAPVLPVARPPALADLVLAEQTRADVEAALIRCAAHPPAKMLFGIRGRAGDGRDSLALAVARTFGFPAIEVGVQVDQRVVVRESRWALAAVVIAGMPPTDAVLRLAAELATPLIVILDPHDSTTTLLERCPWYEEIAIRELSPGERAEVWRRGLGDAPGADLALQAQRHVLGAGRVATLCKVLLAQRPATAPITSERITAARRRLYGAAPPAGVQRLESPYSADDLIVPPATARELQIVRAWASHGTGGLVCMFCGPPGTGKTMAAQVLARELDLELHRVDLSQIVNKYIGETEKNLDRAFASAQESGAILFFDEADALFARRTDVRDANDRYANMETAFLLQRVESHRGLVILATNLRKNFDEAFLRRIHVVAEFRMPEVDERRRIWERHLRGVPCEPDVDLDLFARQFKPAGGDIKNAVATARLLADRDGVGVGRDHLAIGLWRELSKSGRIVSPDDFGPMRDIVRTYLGMR